MRTPLGGCFCKSYLLCESASFGHHFCLSVEDRDGISIHHGEVTFYLIPVSFYLRDFLETDIDISWNNCAVCQDTIIVSIATKRKSSNNVFEQYRAITSLKSKSQHHKEVVRWNVRGASILSRSHPRDPLDWYCWDCNSW